MKKFITTFIILLTSILPVNASIQYSNDSVIVQRGYNNKIHSSSIKKNNIPPKNIQTYNPTKQNKHANSNIKPSCTPCQAKKVDFEKFNCMGNPSCTRTGFARPQNRLAVPYKGFAQPNKRLARPKVRCNHAGRTRNYYSGGMPKGGMTKRYGSNKNYTKTMPKIGMTKRYGTTSSTKKTPDISRFNKNFSTRKASKPLTCKGITYYNSGNICK